MIGSQWSVVGRGRGGDSAVAGTRVADARRRAFGQLASVVIVVVAISVYVQLAPRRDVTPAPVAEVAADQSAPANVDDADSDVGDDRGGRGGGRSAAPVARRRRPSLTGPRSPLRRVCSTRPAAIVRGPTSGPPSRPAGWRWPAARPHLMPRGLASWVSWCAIPRRGSPRRRPAAASSRGERDKLEKEVSTLRQLPRPKSTSILSKSPVARPAASSESHFELRHNRVSFIDLERLLEMTKADAQLRIRMSDQMAAISNKVGPAGSFSLEYELVKSVPGSMEELIERKVHAPL